MIKRTYLTYKDLAKYIKTLHLSSLRNYIKWHKQHNPKLIPRRPNCVYKEWTNWNDFLGNKNLRLGERRYKVNENYFKKWSSSMSYILGLWFADGCITRNTFRIGLQKRDACILNEIAKEMGFGGKIREEIRIKRGKKYYLHVLDINSKIMVIDIINRGGKYRKSLDVKFPYVPKKYLPDFIRGFWDGDGTLMGDKASIVGGSKVLIYKLQKILKENIKNFKGIIYTTVTDKGFDLLGYILKKDIILYHLNLSLNETRRLRKYMYGNDFICNKLKLIRKWKKIKETGKICLHEKYFISYQDAKIVMIKNNVKSVTKFKELKEKNRFPKIPKNPGLYYNEWISWYDFLGKEKIKYFTYKQAKKYMKDFDIKNWNEFKKKRPINIPFHPDRTYKEWVNADNFFKETYASC